MEIVTCIVSLVGGLAIFLYSMKMLSGGLEAAAGSKLQSILEKLTSNRFLGLFVGMLLAALVQSSSTTTVMVVGFVNANLLNLTQALWVIMGANIGTNITSQLVAFRFSEVAPIIAIVGVLTLLFTHKKKYAAIGQIVTGLGFIFISTSIMSGAMEPVKDNPSFREFLTGMDNPILGILVGIVFVAIIQSSAAGVAVLQTLAASGVIGLDQAIFILYGMHVGTCITAILSSVGSNRNALRTAMMHLLFNVVGCVLMTILTLTLPIVGFMQKISGSPMRQIANAHLLFALVTTLALLPFGKLIVKFVQAVVPDKQKTESAQKLIYLSPAMLRTDTTTAVLIASVRNEVARMYDMASKNVTKALNAVLNNSEEIQAEINDTEEYIDYLNKEISYYISHSLARVASEDDAITLSTLFKITGNVERMGDHATNISGYANLLQDKGYKLSAKACFEVQQMIQVLSDGTFILYGEDTTHIHVKVAKIEQKIDDMTALFRKNQITRMTTGECSGEACVIYSEMLTDFERLGDHLLNIAEAASEHSGAALYTASVTAKNAGAV
ncbi:MAG: Na/Pi cotransporter family protein [Clostridiales bacterium]|nr:Na/Pi cotransporter family protein [Clostridiales bacterium]